MVTGRFLPEASASTGPRAPTARAAEPYGPRAAPYRRSRSSVTLAIHAWTGLAGRRSAIFAAMSLFNWLHFPLSFYPVLIGSLSSGKKLAEARLLEGEVVPHVKIEERRDLVDGRSGRPCKGGASN